MIQKMIVDADLCIKLGGSEKYPFLQNLLPLIAEEIYIHSHVLGEVLIPKSAHEQLNNLVKDGSAIVVNETELSPHERAVYDTTFKKLEAVMIDPRRPKKNMGETCSLAYAKVKSIPIFATDEYDLQPIIDSRLNTGMDNISCLRIVDIITMGRKSEIELSRKTAKAIWVISGKNKTDFDRSIWPLE